MAGTTITDDHVDQVQKWLDLHFKRFDSKAGKWGAPSMPPAAGNAFYSRSAKDYIGIIGIPVGKGMIQPKTGGGRQTISYFNKWMTGDYDLFEVVRPNDNCDKVTETNGFLGVRSAINKGCQWDAIQHAAQAQWKPTKEEQKEGVAEFDMNVEVRKVLRGEAPLDHAIEWHPKRKKMAVIDAPLTVVSGAGVVTLKEKQDVKDALICQGCAK